MDGMLSLQDYLKDNGADLEGWQLQKAWSISGDGRFISGYGINPYGNVEGWLASSVPEPSSFILFGIAGIGLGIGAWRRRRRNAN